MKTYPTAPGFLFDLGVYPLSFSFIATCRELYLDNFNTRIPPSGESATSRPLVITKGNSMNFTKKIAAGSALIGTGINSALAAVPAEVTTALTAAKDDGIVVASAVLVAVVAIFAFKLMRRGL